MLTTLKDLKQLIHDIEHSGPSWFEVPQDAPIMLQLNGEEREFPLDIATEDGGLRFHLADGAIHINLESRAEDVTDAPVDLGREEGLTTAFHKAMEQKGDLGWGFR